MDTCSSCTLKLQPPFTLQGRKTCLEVAVSHLFYIPLASLSFSISFYTNFKLMCLNFKHAAAVDWLTLSLVMNKIVSQQTPFQELQQQLQSPSPFPVLLFRLLLWRKISFQQRCSIGSSWSLNIRLGFNKGRKSGFLPHPQTQKRIKHNLAAIIHNKNSREGFFFSEKDLSFYWTGIVIIIPLASQMRPRELN